MGACGAAGEQRSPHADLERGGEGEELRAERAEHGVEARAAEREAVEQQLARVRARVRVRVTKVRLGLGLG